MRIGVTISGTLHLAAICAAALGLPLFDPPQPAEEQVMLVDMVTIADETTSQPQAPVPAEKAPLPEPPKAAEALPPKPPPKPAPAPEPVAREAEPPAPKSRELVAPPAPDPEPIEAKAPPEPAPKPPEPAPAPEVAKPKPPEPAPKKPEEKVQVAAKPPEPKPVAKAEPKPPSPFAAAPQPRAKPQHKPEPKRPSFDLNRIAALLDKSQKQPAAQGQDTQNQPAAQAKPVPRARLTDQPLTMSEIDAIRYQIEQCWSVPAGARDAEDLIVRIRVFLNPDGTLSRPPEIVDQAHGGSDSFYRTAAESARRAVLQCAPLKHLPTDKYALWRELTLTFNPRQMLGG